MAGPLEKIVRIVVQAVNESKKALTQTSADLKKVQSASDTTGKSFDQLGKKEQKLAQQSKGLADNFGQLMSEMSSLAMTVAAVAFPVTEAAKFERAMSEVAAISGATGKDLEGLTNVAREMGRTTEYSATEAASGLKYLAMAGLDATQSMTALPSVLQLAQAGALDLGQAADIATNIMTGFRMNAEDLAEVNDKLVATFTTTNSTLGEIGYGMSYVAPIASGLGANFDDLTSSMGLLHNAGIKASMAGTSLRGALDALFNPTANEAEMMDVLAKRIGKTSLETRDAEGNFIGFLGIVEQLEDANLTAAEAMRLFGQRAGPAMAALLGQGSAALKDQIEYLEQSEGISEQIAKTMTDNTIGAFKELQSAVSGLAIEIGNKLLPIITKVIDEMTKMVGAATSLAQEFPNIAKYVTLAATALVGYVAATKAANIATMAFGATATKVFGAVAALLAGWQMGRFIGEWRGFGITIDEIVQQMYGRLFQALNEIGGWFQKATNTAKAAWASMVSGVLQGILALMDMVDRVPGIGDILGIDREGDARQYIQNLVTSYNQMGAEAAAANAKIEESVKRKNQAHQDTIDMIDREGRLAVLAEQKQNLEREKAITLQEEKKKATAEVTKEIQNAQKAVDQMGKRLGAEADKFNLLRTNAQTALDDIGTLIEENIESAWEGADTVDAVGRALDTQLSLIEDHEEKKKDLIEAGAEAFVTSAEARRDVERKTQEEIRKLEFETLQKKRDAYERAAEALQDQLDEGLEQEKEIADEIVAIQDKVRKARMTGAERLAELRQKQMSEEEVYQANLASVQAKYAEANRIMATDTERAIELINDAMQEAAKLDDEVKEGTEVLVTADEASQAAIKNVEQGMALLSKAEQTRVSALKSTLTSTEQHNKAVADELKNVNKRLDDTSAKVAEGFQVEVNIDLGDFAQQIAEITKQREVIVAASTDFNQANQNLGALLTKKTEIEKGVTIQVEADYARAMKTIEYTEQQLKGIEGAKIRVDADTEGANQNITRLKEHISTVEDVQTTIAVDSSGATATIGDLQSRVSDLRDQVSERLQTNIDTSQGAAEMVALQLQADDLQSGISNLQMQVDVENAKRDVEATQQVVNTLTGIVDQGATYTVNTGEAVASIESVQSDIMNLSAMLDRETMTVDIQTVKSREAMQALAQELVRIEEQTGEPYHIRADVDDTNVEEFSLRIRDLNEEVRRIKEEKVTVQVDADLSGAQQEVDNLAYGIESLDDEAENVEILPVAADVKGGEEIGQLNQDLESIPPETETTATFDAGKALAGINQVKQAIESIPKNVTTKHKVEFTGKASPEGPLMSTIDTVTTGLKNMQGVASRGASFNVDFDTGNEIKNIADGIKGVRLLSATPIQVKLDIDPARKAADALRDKYQKIIQESREMQLKLEADRQEQMFAGPSSSLWKAFYDQSIRIIDKYQGRIDTIDHKFPPLEVDASQIEAAETAIQNFSDRAEGLQSAYAGVLEELENRLTTLRDEIDSINADIAGETATTDQLLEQLHQGTLTDEEKWYRQRELYEKQYQDAVEQMQAGQFEAAAEGFKAARDLAANLATEVKDSNGEVVMSLEETTQLARDLVIKSGEQVTEALTKQREEMVLQQQQVKKSMEETKSVVAELSGTVAGMGDLLGQEYTVQIDTSEAEKNLDALEERLRNLSAESGNGGNRGAPGGEPMASGGKVKKSLIRTSPGEWYFGKDIVSRIGVATMDAINRGSAAIKGFASGGRIRGSSAGDSVLMAAEQGGYVIRKAVAQGNRNLMNSILNYPERVAGMMAGAMQSDIPKYATGGMIPEQNQNNLGKLELTLGETRLPLRGESDQIGAFMDKARRDKLRRRQ